MTSKRAGIEASREHPCPVCNHARWCLLFPEGTNCYREQYGADHTDSQGNTFWYHPFIESQANPRPTFAPQVCETLRGKPDQLDRVYGELVNQHSLKPDHEAILIRGGLTKAAIQRFGFKSAHQSRKKQDEVAQSLADQFPGYWLSTPGLVVKNDKPHLKAYGGILIPWRDTRGMITGIQLRLDDSDLEKAKIKDPDASRYIWLSSKKENGPGANPSPGWWGPVGKPVQTVRLTEGAKKSVVTLEFTGIPSLSAPTGAGSMAGPKMLDAIEYLRPRFLLVTFDQDAFYNPQVTQQVRKAIPILVGFCADQNIQMKAEVW